MIAVTPVTDPKSYVIDPLIDGLSSTVWVNENDNTVISGGKYQLNNTSLRSVPQFLYGEVDFKVTIPSAPTTGHARTIGFKGVSVGNRGALLFTIVGAVFTASVYTNDGTLFASQVIPWNAAWTNTPISLVISHLDTNATFIVRTAAGAADEYKKAFDLATRTLLETKIVEISNALFVDNDTVDNLLVSYVALNNIQRVTSAEHFAGLVPSDGTGIPVHIENASVITQSPTYNVFLDEASATITYVGEALPGVAASSALWRIKRLDSTSGLLLTWADGDADFDKIWNNRASYSYS